jgi:exo-beta-1,3-glucanase (GH17 family)
MEISVAQSRSVAAACAVRSLLFGLLGVGWLGACVAQTPAGAVCRRADAAAPGLRRLEEALADGRFVTYQPTSLKVVNGQVTTADAASIRADLRVLRSRFDSLITYDAVHGAQQIPAIARELHYRSLVIGVWDPADATQIEAALAAARAYPQLVVGITLGNELLFGHRTDAARLAQQLAQLHSRRPALALSTSEPFHVYGEPGTAALLAQLDFLLPNVHPVFQPWFHGAGHATSVQFVVNVVTGLATHFCGPILVKETGIPTAPPGGDFSEAAQAAFYQELRQRFPATPQRAFAYFAAFDAPWRAFDVTPVGPARPEEAHWGLYDAQREPKAAARELPLLPTSPPVPP